MIAILINRQTLDGLTVVRKLIKVRDRRALRRAAQRAANASGEWIGAQSAKSRGMPMPLSGPMMQHKEATAHVSRKWWARPKSRVNAADYIQELVSKELTQYQKYIVSIAASGGKIVAKHGRRDGMLS